MAVHRIRGGVASPAEEDVAIGLHQVPPGDDTLVPVGVLTAPAVADQELRLGPRDSPALPSGPRPDPSEKPTYQTFRPRHQSSLLWPLLLVQPGDAAELYALPIALLVLIPVKRAHDRRHPPRGVRIGMANLRVLNPPRMDRLTPLAITSGRPAPVDGRRAPSAPGQGRPSCCNPIRTPRHDADGAGSQP
jgi:hypothetical protein